MSFHGEDCELRTVSCINSSRRLNDSFFRGMSFERERWPLSSAIKPDHNSDDNQNKADSAKRDTEPTVGAVHVIVQLPGHTKNSHRNLDV